MNETIVGIDLGTTFSVIAWVDESGTARVIRNAEGQKSTPSAVRVCDGCIEVGDIALNQCVVDSAHVVQWIKRAIHDREYRFQGMSATEISAEILRKLKNDAEVDLGIEIQQAVITCPAYFDANEVEQTRLAGELAGLKVKEIVREPVAAAVYWGVTNLGEGEHVLVCDLGGGTFDATVLTLENGRFRPISTRGNRELGGHDWTKQLLEEVVSEFTDIFGADPTDDLPTGQRLYEACEQAKRALSHSSETSIACSYGGRTETITITREQFERDTRFLMDQVVDRARKALAAVEIAGADGNPRPMTWSDIDYILLVGGATRMPRVAEALKEASGIEPDQTSDPDTVVALGAAVLGAGVFRPRAAGGLAAEAGARSGAGLTVAQQQGHAGLITIDYERTACRNLGTRVIAIDGDERRIINSEIIPERSECPAEAMRQYSTAAPDAPFFDVPVVEFDDVDADSVLDTWRFECPPGTPMGTPIEVTFRYVDPSGRVDVDARYVPTGAMLPKERVAYAEPDLTGAGGAPSQRHVVFALDISGSMIGEKLTTAKEALITHACHFLKAGQGKFSVGVAVFESYARVACPLTTDPAVVTNAVRVIEATGGTAMAEGIDVAAGMLADSPPDTYPEIALLTDGMPNNPDATISAARRATERGLRLSAVTIDKDGVNEEFLRKLTENVFEIEGAEELGEWLGGFLADGAAQTAAQSQGITWGDTR